MKLTFSDREATSTVEPATDWLSGISSHFEIHQKFPPHADVDCSPSMYRGLSQYYDSCSYCFPYECRHAHLSLLIMIIANVTFISFYQCSHIHTLRHEIKYGFPTGHDEVVLPQTSPIDRARWR
jgi:hypothetical protein